MKKVLLATLVLLMAAQSLFATQLIFNMDHPIYDEMDALYLIEGKATASGTRPWSDNEARRMLDAVNPKTDAGRALKAKIDSYLEDREGPVGYFDVAFTPTISYHTNSTDFDEYSDWFGTVRQDSDLLTLEGAFAHSDYIALLGGIGVSVTPSDLYDMVNAGKYYPENTNVTFPYYRYGTLQTPSNGRIAQNFSLNIPYIMNAGPLSWTFPERAYLATGNDALRFTVGRDRLSWGNGMTGNMMLGDTLPYHDYLSFTYTGNDIFHYQFLMSFFTHSQNFELNNDRYQLKGIRFFMGHRFEFSFLENTLKFVFNESIMYASEDGSIDFGVLNPLMFLHNLYIPGNSNSLLTLELEWAPIRGLTVYGQIAIDDMPIWGEAKAPNDGATPNAMGYMLGVKGTIPRFDDDYFYYGAEFVYTNPFLYHRALDREHSAYDLYYTSSTHMTYNGASNRYLIRYLSFPFGSDALVGQLRFGYNDPGNYKAEANIFAMAHGIMNQFSEEYRYNGTGQQVPGFLATVNPFANPSSQWEKGSGEIEYSLTFGGEGEWNVLNWLSLDGALYGNLVWNKDNVKQGVVFDLQISAGVSLHY